MDVSSDPAAQTAPPAAESPVATIDAAKVLIMIPTLNEERHIESVIRALIIGDDVAAQARLVVADGGSTDRTREIVERLSGEFPNVSLLHNPDKLQAAAINMAIRPEFADAEVLIRCDAHAGYPPDFVSRLVASLAARDADSVVVPMDAVAVEGCFQQGLAWVADTKLGAGGSAHRGGATSSYIDHGHHAAFRLATFRKLGGYDPSFVANEDAEYDRRVIASGGKIWLDAAIRKDYYPRPTAAGLWKQYYRYGVGRAMTCWKHKVRPKPRQLIPVFHVGLLAFSLLLTPFTILGWAWPLAYGALIVGAGVSIAWSKKSLCGLHATTALAVMHLAWGLGFIRETLAQLLGAKRSTHGLDRLEGSAS